jgi:uncharacterized protein
MKGATNYGIQRGYDVGRPAFYDAAPGPGVPPDVRSEYAMSVLAHLSTFLNLFTGFLGPVAALGIWLVYRDRSRMVASHALRSAWYQVAWLVVIVVGWTVTAALMVVLVGFLLVPVMLLLTLAPFAHATYAAYMVGREGSAIRS